MYPEYIMRLYYDREKAMEDPEKFETLCDMFCYESNFDLCDVNSLGDSLKFTVLSFLKFRRDFLTYRYDVPIDPKVLIVFFNFPHTFIKNSFLSPHGICTFVQKIKNKNHCSAVDADAARLLY